ncbi:hypothetical protein RRG08_045617 [Elysia crispata]|uniref:Uncharacterized protein n=1 Tax=Elysia crispata TaxID=231223 RepID=A0AAE1AD77_9GAST|nr:hypothetical protein RRG08_045617 [Elysia crispata]
MLSLYRPADAFTVSHSRYVTVRASRCCHYFRHQMLSLCGLADAVTVRASRCSDGVTIWAADGVTIWAADGATVRANRCVTMSASRCCHCVGHPMLTLCRAADNVTISAR